MCSVRPCAFFGYIRSRSSTVTDGRTVRCCLFQSKQNIGRGSYTLTRVHGWRMLPVIRFPGDLSHGHAPQPHEKTAAATGVLQDRPQSAADAGRKHPGKVKIISLTSTLWRRAEHRPVRLMEPFSFHQTHRHRSSGSCRRAGVADKFHLPQSIPAAPAATSPHTRRHSRNSRPPED